MLAMQAVPMGVLIAELRSQPSFQRAERERRLTVVVEGGMPTVMADSAKLVYVARCSCGSLP